MYAELSRTDDEKSRPDGRAHAADAAEKSRPVMLMVPLATVQNQNQSFIGMHSLS